MVLGALKVLRDTTCFPDDCCRLLAVAEMDIDPPDHASARLENYAHQFEDGPARKRECIISGDDWVGCTEIGTLMV